MTKGKRLCALLGVLVAVCLAAFFVSRQERVKEQIKVSGATILEIPTDSVTALAWENSSGSFSFRLEDGVWLYEADTAFPVDTDKLEGLIEQFERFTAAFTIENADNIGQYGLDDPVCTVTVTTDTDTYEICLGDYSQMDSQRYLTTGDGNVYLASHDPLEEFDAVLRNLVRNDTIPNFGTVEQITFSGTEAEHYTVTYTEEGDSLCEDDVYFTDGKPLDTERVASYLSTVSGLNLTGYVTYNVTDEELTAYGLDEPELTLDILYTEEDTEHHFTLHVGRNREELAAAEEGDSVTSYLRVGDSQLVYALSSTYSYKNLMASRYDDLRHQALFTADFSSLVRMDITLENAEHTFTKGEAEDGDDLWYYAEQAIDVEDLRAALALVEATTFTDDGQITGKEELSLTFTLSNAKALTLAFYRLDGTSCLATADGASVAYVSRDTVIDLIEAVNAIILDA